MKLRLGHVTNSSSTCYLVALNKPTEKTISTEEELLDYINSEYSPEDVRELFEDLSEITEYARGKALLDEGKHIAFVWVDYCEPDINKLFADIGLGIEIQEMPL